MTQTARVVVLLAALGVAVPVSAATPPMPTISAAIAGPGVMYPDPALNIVPEAVQAESFPYVTEEFFVSGTAFGAPYTTRIIVRRPKDVKAFSGTVVAEAQHAGGRSLIFEWSRVSILTRNHIFVEIVHGPANITQLQTFNAERYKTLAIGPGQSNHILAQVGLLLKTRGGVLAPYDVKRVTLMGTSASSGTVRSFLPVHLDSRMANGGPIYDGFLLTSTNGNTALQLVDVPMIQMPTQTEVQTHAAAGIQYRRPDSDAPDNKFRLYEVAGMPHNNARDMRSFGGAPCTLPVTDFPAGAFTAMGLHHLVEWIKGTPPPYALPIEVDQNPAGDDSPLALDEYGNARGGVRNVWVDVPISTYGVFGKGKTTEQDRLCQLAGTEVPLPEATLKKLYRNKGAYEKKVSERLDQLVKGGWFLPEYVESLKADVKATVIP